MKHLIRLLALSLFTMGFVVEAEQMSSKRFKLKSDGYVIFVRDSSLLPLPDSLVEMLNPKPTAADTLNDRFNIKLLSYVDKMGIAESGGRYHITNRFGYKGKYQFGYRTLRGLGYTKEEIREFINNPEMQEEAMVKLTAHNAQVLENYGLSKYIGRHILGVEITMEGLLAASHLRGPYAAAQFCWTGGEVNKKDGNGTTVMDYIKKFQDV